MNRSPHPFEAILLMLLGMCFFSAMNVAIRLLSTGMHPTQMVLLRNIVSLLLVLLWSAALQRRALPRFPTARLKSHVWRASVGLVAMELWFYSLSLMPVTLATALSFTTPIFSVIFALAFLGEKAGIRRWSAIGIGFVGMLIILRPGSGGIGPQAMFVIASSAMMAVAGVLVKHLSRTERPETIVFYMALVMTFWSIWPALPHLNAVTPREWWLVLLIALFSTAAHLIMPRAYVRADMVVLLPFDFTRLIFTAMIAYPLFGETLDAPTIAGSALIVASSVYIAHREAKLHRLKGLQ